MDAIRFQKACSDFSKQGRREDGIGTLGEKALHAIVKTYIADDPSCHEQRVGAYVVDVFTDGQIFEIQTRQFNKLKAKLAALLPEYRVTIVHPLPARKWLIWLDPQSGELTRPRLSPRRGKLSDAFTELYRIKPFLSHPNLSLQVLLVDLEEYRLLNGWSTDRKRGSWRSDRVPLALVDEMKIEGPAAYNRLLTSQLPESFTSADLARTEKISLRRAQTAIHILNALGTIEPNGKRGRYRLYQLKG